MVFLGTLLSPLVGLFGGEYKVHMIHHYIAWCFLFFTIVHVYGIPEKTLWRNLVKYLYGFWYEIYAHDPIDIEDLNGKRRRGERIEKPSFTTYRPSDPNDPRERENYKNND